MRAIQLVAREDSWLSHEAADLGVTLEELTTDIIVGISGKVERGQRSRN